MADIKALADTVFTAVKGYVDKAVGALAERISAIEAEVKTAAETEFAALREQVAALPVPKDGTPGRDGTDGTSVTLEEVTAWMEGAMAKWALDFERRAQDVLQRAIDKIPPPRDGAPGKDGKDGLGFDDLEVIHDGERSITLRFARGDQVSEYSIDIPAVLDRGVWRDAQAYAKGDGCTWAGSYWIAQKDAPVGKPDAGNGDWRLAVKRGRDGRDGDRGEKGEKGDPGKRAS